ncbi:MAG TPA: pinensin family lanthipeptide [Longimicrobium sp.]|nr:pinensin family lanthipeptide [Longimicrobium sp.]
MRKLKLDLDALAVESFETAADGAPAAGTVHAHHHTRGHDTCQFSCELGCTNDVSCFNPCI